MCEKACSLLHRFNIWSLESAFGAQFPTLVLHIGSSFCAQINLVVLKLALFCTFTFYVHSFTLFCNGLVSCAQVHLLEQTFTLQCFSFTLFAQMYSFELMLPFFCESSLYSTYVHSFLHSFNLFAQVYSFELMLHFFCAGSLYRTHVHSFLLLFISCVQIYCFCSQDYSFMHRFTLSCTVSLFLHKFFRFFSVQINLLCTSSLF